MKEYTVKTLKETSAIAKEFAQKLKAGDLVALIGDLGAGKTAFVQALCHYFKVEGYVNSPTFTIVNEYESKKCKINHIDFYRINHSDELMEIGIDEYFNENSITLIEWANLFPEVLPKEYYQIKIDLLDGCRRIEITNA